MGYLHAAVAQESGPAHTQMLACQLCLPHAESLTRHCWHDWREGTADGGAPVAVVVDADAGAAAAAEGASQLWTEDCHWGMPCAVAPAASGPHALLFPVETLAAAMTAHLYHTVFS